MKGFSESNSTGLNTSGGSKSLSHSDYVRSLHKDENLGLDDDDSIVMRALECEKDVSLRQWLDNPDRSIDAFECFHVFRQIVEIVNAAHSQGIVVHNVRPSCFVVSSFKHVSFIESASWSDEETKTKSMEMSWYKSPEEDNGFTSNCASDVYRLGVLLFELFCSVSSRQEKSRTMSSLRHRVLPPQILLNWPKEASFCLWLLHPEPSYRPLISELLQSEFFNEPRENLEEREAAMELQDRIEKHELLLEFLMMIQQRKQEAADKLRDTVSFLSSDIDQVVTRQLVLKQKGNDVSSFLVSRKGFRQGFETAATEDTLLESSRLLTNIKKLESVYFATRYRQIKALSSNCRTSESNTTQPPKEPINEARQGVWIDPFLESLCKYLSFSKLNVKADLKQGDLLNSSNLVCAIAFDRDGEIFATAGVNKKIKIFECESIIKDGLDIHYPVVELASQSKLSSICWNSYIKSQVASSNFEGVVQVWDVARSKLVTEMKEHEKRVWSIDISSADPTLLASGSDDGSVKLWSINQGVSIGTIKTKANVCCVQFPSDSGRNIAFGSADHKVYYYDLRNPKIPLSTMIGHNKTVSYVRFVDSSTLVSSSTDNTLKLWDLSMSVSGVNETPLHSFMGHTNVKNFVGLSVSDGYIATGSETNEVFVYHKAFPMPVLSYKFKTIDPVSNLEVEDASQFISSVCWRGQSSTLVAANSTGNIKILEMV